MGLYVPDIMIDGLCLVVGFFVRDWDVVMERGA